MARTDRPGEAMGGGETRGLGVSVRSKGVDMSTKRMVNKQNKAADSYKIKDLDKLEKGQKYRAEKKLRDAATKTKELKTAEKKGMVKGAAATVAVGAAAKLTAASNDKKKATPKPTPKATVKAKPMTEAQKQAKALDALEAKRAAVAKKTGKRPNYGTN
jgi:hypothetical protein